MSLWKMLFNFFSKYCHAINQLFLCVCSHIFVGLIFCFNMQPSFFHLCQNCNDETITASLDVHQTQAHMWQTSRLPTTFYFTKDVSTHTMSLHCRQRRSNWKSLWIFPVIWKFVHFGWWGCFNSQIMILSCTQKLNFCWTIFCLTERQSDQENFSIVFDSSKGHMWQVYFNIQQVCNQLFFSFCNLRLLCFCCGICNCKQNKYGFHSYNDVFALFSWWQSWLQGFNSTIVKQSFFLEVGRSDCYF